MEMPEVTITWNGGRGKKAGNKKAGRGQLLRRQVELPGELYSDNATRIRREETRGSADCHGFATSPPDSSRKLRHIKLRGVR
jgi:hypothetical protein